MSTKKGFGNAVATLDGEPIGVLVDAWAPGSFEQASNRLIRGRLVHAQRARKLRRRGELVRHAGYNDNGRAMFRWVKDCPVVFFDAKARAVLASPSDQARYRYYVSEDSKK